MDLQEFLIRDVRLRVNMEGHTRAQVEGLNVEAQGKVNDEEIDVALRLHLEPALKDGPNVVFTSTQDPGTDVQTLARTDLHLTTQDLNLLHLTGTFGLNQSTVRVGEPLPSPDFNGTVDLSVDHKQAWLDLKRLALDFERGNRIQVSGKAEKILTGPDFQFSVEQVLFRIEDLIAWAGDRLPPLEAKGRLEVKDLQAMGALPDFKPETLVVEGGTVRLSEVEANHPASGAQVAGLNLTVALDKALVHQGMPQSAGADVSLSIKQAKAPQASVQGVTHTLKVQAKGPKLSQAQLDFSLAADAVTASVPQVGTLRTPFNLTGSGAARLETGGIEDLNIDFAAGQVLSGKLTGEAVDFGKQSFSATHALDLDLARLKTLLPAAFVKKLGGFPTSGKLHLTAEADGKLDEALQPLRTALKTQLDVTGLDAALADPPVLTNGVSLSLTAPVDYDAKAGVQVADLHLTTQFKKVQALDKYALGPGEVKTRLKMQGRYDLKHPDRKLPVTGSVQVSLSSVESSAPSLSIKGLALDTALKSDLYGKEFKNAAVEGTLAVDAVAGLKPIRTGRIDTAFAVNANDISLTKTKAVLKLNVAAPKGKPGEGEIPFGPIALVSDTAQNLKQGDVQIKTISLKAPGLVDFHMKGSLENWGESFDVHSKVSQMRLAALWDRVPVQFRTGLEDLSVASGVAAVEIDAKGKLPKNFQLSDATVPVTGTVRLRLDDGSLSWPSKAIAVDSLGIGTNIDLLKGSGTISGKVAAEKLFLKDALGEAYLNPAFEFKYALSDFNKLTLEKHAFLIPNRGLRHTFAGRVDGLKPFLTGKVPFKVEEAVKRLDIALTTENRLQAEKALADTGQAFFKDFQANGALHSNLKLKLAAGKKVELQGEIEFDKFNAQIPAGVTVKNVSGKFPFNKTLLLDRKFLKPQQESFSASKKGFFSQLRDFSRYKNNLMIDAVTVSGQTISNIGMDLLFRNNQLRAEKFLFDVLEGSVAGNLFVAQTAAGPELNFSTEFAGLNFGGLVGRSRADEKAFSEIDGNMQMGIQVAQGTGKERISLDQIFTRVAVTRIGADAFDRALLFLDPEESKPAIVDTRAKLKLASPHKILLTLENGNLNVEAWLKNKVLGDILKAPELKRVPVASLKQFKNINDQLQALSKLTGVLNLLAAQGMEFDEAGTVQFF